MKASYKATYSDANGQEQTAIHNDGNTLEMRVRGVLFIGWMLDDFKPTISPDDAALSTFSLSRDSDGSATLCAYTLTFDMPLPIGTSGGIQEGMLRVQIELGSQTERGNIDGEVFVLTLYFGGAQYQSRGRSGWIEEELLDIQRLLPENVFMRACINCAYSDYSVYGSGAFGCLLCYRDCKEDYLRIQSKAEYSHLMKRFTATVQETYLCDEFDRRKPGAGYRG